MYTDIRIQQETIDVTEITNTLRAQNTNIGAIVTFFGTVRERGHGAAIDSIWLEHYPGMTETHIAMRLEKAQARFAIEAVSVIHRVGTLKATEPIVLVAVASMHRKDAFLACEYIMDYLKNEVPLWKKVCASGKEEWVEQKEQDRKALNKWQQQNTKSSTIA